MEFRVALRADASLRIGLGHVKRCLSLASALIQLGAEVVLVARNLGVDVSGLASTAGVRLCSLPGRSETFEDDRQDIPHRAWAEVDWKTDAEECIAALSGRGSFEWLVVDHYAFDADWHAAIRQGLGCKVAVVDDLADRLISADVLIDHNYSEDHQSKYAAVLIGSTVMLGGAKFALLGANYSAAQKYRFSEHVRSIGIFMGGIDAGGWSTVAWRACRAHAGFAGQIEIATTSGNPNLESLRALVLEDLHVSLLLDAPDLASFFSRHDLQIGAGGGALLERACIGAPTVAFACALNQRRVISEMARIGVIASLEAGESASAESIGTCVSRVGGDTNARQELSQRAMALVDGRGAQRVALFLLREGLRIRAAELGDSVLLHEWRNHESTRAVSGNSAEISWETHERWFKSTIEGSSRHLFVAMVGDLAIGAIRFDDRTDSEVEISLYLDPKLHGLGLGRRLLSAGEDYLAARLPTGGRIVARILDGNVVSQKLFAAAGFSLGAGGLYCKRMGH